MTPLLTTYKTLVFDYDGVVLDSNQMKTEAFRQAALPYGAEAADALVDYHVANGGISRHRKFEHFLAEIVPGQPSPDLDTLLDSYAGAALSGLMSCAIAPGSAQLRRQTSKAAWMIVSGGDQLGLRTVFARRGIADLFEGGIHGSPEPNNEIVARLQKDGALRLPALFLGDSTYDYRVAAAAGIDFLFVSGWSEVANWPGFVEQHGLDERTAIGDLVVPPSAGNQAHGDSYFNASVRGLMPRRVCQWDRKASHCASRAGAKTVSIGSRGDAGKLLDVLKQDTFVAQASNCALTPTRLGDAAKTSLAAFSGTVYATNLI